MIQSADSTISYVGNESTVVPYAIPYKFFDEADLVVVVKDELDQEDIQSLGADYSVTGANEPTGGNVIFTWPVPATSQVTIYRSIEATQLTSYEEADAFPAKSHERALDKLTCLVQQLSRGIGTGNGESTDLGTAFRLTEASGGISAVSRVNDSTLGLDPFGAPILRTASEMLGWLGEVATVWQDTAERINTRGAYAGQVGVQLDNYTIYLAHSTAPGDWLPFLPGTGIVYAVDGVPEMHPAPSGELVGTDSAQILTNKTLIEPTITDPAGLNKADVGLGNVDNTSDINKPVSAATNAALSTKQPYSEKGFADGYASLDSAAKIPLSQIPDALVGASQYQGTWNASTNSPTIPAAATGNKGWYYVVSVAGSQNPPGASLAPWAVGDQVISSGSAWQKIPNVSAVTSVNGRTGAVVVNKADVGLSNVDNTSDAQQDAASSTLTNKTIIGANQTLMQVRLDADVTNNLPVSRLNNGTGATAVTWWCGDGSWKAPSGTGDVNGPNGSADGELPVFSGTTGKLIRRYTGGTGFAKLQNNAAVTSQSLILAPDLDPGVIHSQTQKTTDLVDADELLVWDSSVSALRRLAASKVRHLPGQIVQTVYAELTAEILISGNTNPPHTSTNGTQFISAAITPVYSNSKILVRAGGGHQSFRTGSAVTQAAFWLIVSGTSTPLSEMLVGQWDATSGHPQNFFLNYMHTPGTGAKTYSVRASISGVGAGTHSLYINGYGQIAAGYALGTTLTLQEIKQ